MLTIRLDRVRNCCRNRTPKQSLQGNLWTLYNSASSARETRLGMTRKRRKNTIYLFFSAVVVDRSDTITLQKGWTDFVIQSKRECFFKNWINLFPALPPLTHRVAAGNVKKSQPIPASDGHRPNGQIRELNAAPHCHVSQVATAASYCAHSHVSDQITTPR